MRQLSTREKKVTLIGGVLAFIIISYYLFTWYSDIKAYTKGHLEAKRLNLERQLNKISEREDIQERLETINVELKSLEKGLLSGDKPPVAAAELQRLLKEMALSSGIDIKSERAMGPVDMGLYLRIPVEIGFTASTAKLKDMLYRIKTSSLLFTMSRIKVRVTNIRNPSDAYTTLIVSGFIKKPYVEDKDQKDAL